MRNESSESRPSRTEAWDIANETLSKDHGNDSLADKVTLMIGQHPVASVTAAALAGIAAGWLVKRKL